MLLHSFFECSAGFWPIPLMLLGAALLGYLLGRGAGDTPAEISRLRAELDECRSSMGSAAGFDGPRNQGIASGMASGMVAGFAVPKPRKAFDAAAAKAAFGKTIQYDDLKLVEGIGPKIEEILKKNGIYTWRDLSQAEAGKIREFLLNEDPRYRIQDPESWPHQARLADEGEWQKLKALQDALNAGRA